MARTIGVKYKNLVKRLVVEARSKEIYGNHAIFEYNMDLVHNRKG